ncbi:ABC-type transport auxiliary lipoprotein family protein [Marinicella meishanensis]|uniref:ABC-type transport auxiliary lipoprotein family protein n=1 Tax=Marinicella meishanensis TaxID=2873263 RepID=UPI001CC14839|nr:ABC-type transport auxiliary lipoprotein family protein [Marinicella sp. NBU2979]
MNRLILTLLVCCLTLAACSNQKAQSKKYFRLPATAQAATAEPKPLTLVIKRPKALSVLGGRPMVATQADGSLVQLSHHFWLESPKVLLQDHLKQWATGRWQSVSTQVPAQAEHQILDARILAFEKNQQLAQVSLEFMLYDADNRMLFSRQYVVQHNIDGEGYRAFSRAMGLAVDQILSQLAMDLIDVQ